jgi:hypothetical protein
MLDKFSLKLINPITQAFFLLFRLPSAYFSGVRVRYVSEKMGMASVPYKWFTKNPFKSTYFASLAMAAEMSTGIIVLAHLYKKEYKVSMLVRKIEGTFYKKATKRTMFVCEDGGRIESAIEEAVATGKSVYINTYTSGKDKDDELIANFTVSWSFKVKTPKA